jgi:Nucleotide modification associated domain 2
MRVTDALRFDEYWGAPQYRCKRPVRNGSRKTIVGDNIYHHDLISGQWVQEDSHHSQPNGAQDPYNVQHDTQTDRVLVSEHFYYFGSSAPLVPPEILHEIGYQNRRNHRVFSMEAAFPLISWLEESFGKRLNQVMGDPYQFENNSARYSSKADKVI